MLIDDLLNFPIFRLIGDFCSKFSNLGAVFLIGDLNSWIEYDFCNREVFAFIKIYIMDTFNKEQSPSCERIGLIIVIVILANKVIIVFYASGMNYKRVYIIAYVIA